MRYKRKALPRINLLITGYAGHGKSTFGEYDPLRGSLVRRLITHGPRVTGNGLLTAFSPDVRSMGFM
jgi:hypothetical protein